jgi:hypothetical protein
MKNRGENWKIRNKMDPVIAIIILKVNSWTHQLKQFNLSAWTKNKQYPIIYKKSTLQIKT